MPHLHVWSIEKTALFGLPVYKIWFGSPAEPRTRKVGSAWTLRGARKIATACALKHHQKPPEQEREIVEQFSRHVDKPSGRIGFKP